VAAALVAAGIWVPSAALADNIPLGDPGFEDYAVNAGIGYAYSGSYRPTSAWVDDPDMGSDEDALSSNWLYDANYAEPDGSSNGNGTGRGAPTGGGDQAMHGRGHYSGQETNATFEAGKTYLFSIWAQGDDNTFGDESRVWLYIYDGDVDFNETNALVAEKFNTFDGDFVNREENATQAESQAAWQQITTSHFVAYNAPEIGHPVGVAFWVGDDGAVDNASLEVIPEPTTLVLVTMAGAVLLAPRRRKQ